jgi:Amiloride-sensitive sodium channel
MLVVDRIEKFFEDEEETAETDSSVDEFFEKYIGFQGNVTSFFRHYPDGMQERMHKDSIEVSSRLGLVANLGKDLASSAGIQAEDFIIECQFLGGKCNVSQSFVKHFDSYYFNCFTFDPKVGFFNHSSVT